MAPGPGVAEPGVPGPGGSAGPGRAQGPALGLAQDVADVLEDLPRSSRRAPGVAGHRAGETGGAAAAPASARCSRCLVSENWVAMTTRHRLIMKKEPTCDQRERTGTEGMVG